jgi:hypothetical protein
MIEFIIIAGLLLLILFVVSSKRSHPAHVKGLAAVLARRCPSCRTPINRSASHCPHCAQPTGWH